MFRVHRIAHFRSLRRYQEDFLKHFQLDSAQKVDQIHEETPICEVLEANLTASTKRSKLRKVAVINPMNALNDAIRQKLMTVRKEQSVKPLLKQDDPLLRECQGSLSFMDDAKLALLMHVNIEKFAEFNLQVIPINRVTSRYKRECPKMKLKQKLLQYQQKIMSLVWNQIVNEETSMSIDDPWLFLNQCKESNVNEWTSDLVDLVLQTFLPLIPVDKAVQFMASIQTENDKQWLQSYSEMSVIALLEKSKLYISILSQQDFEYLHFLVSLPICTSKTYLHFMELSSERGDFDKMMAFYEKLDLIHRHLSLTCILLSALRRSDNETIKTFAPIWLRHGKVDLKTLKDLVQYWLTRSEFRQVLRLFALASKSFSLKTLRRLSILVWPHRDSKIRKWKRFSYLWRSLLKHDTNWLKMQILSIQVQTKSEVPLSLKSYRNVNTTDMALILLNSKVKNKDNLIQLWKEFCPGQLLGVDAPISQLVPLREQKWVRCLEESFGGTLPLPVLEKWVIQHGIESPRLIEKYIDSCIVSKHGVRSALRVWKYLGKGVMCNKRLALYLETTFIRNK